MVQLLCACFSETSRFPQVCVLPLQSLLPNMSDFTLMSSHTVNRQVRVRRKHTQMGRLWKIKNKSQRESGALPTLLTPCKPFYANILLISPLFSPQQLHNLLYNFLFPCGLILMALFQIIIYFPVSFLTLYFVFFLNSRLSFIFILVRVHAPKSALLPF